MNNDKKKTRDLIIKIILVIIIIILLIHNCTILKKGKKERIPTGNVDIIEITCDKDDKCDVDDNKNNKDNQSNTSNTGINTNQKTLPVDGQSDSGKEEVIDENGLIVKDKNITWDDSTDLKIFENSMYELEDKIAPESYNTYQFVVKNKTKYNLKYNITFTENNPYNINLKYKLRKNDTYLIDHYVSASELAATNMTLNIDKNDTYYLEWKWISNSNDTEIGANPNSKYDLKIEVKAESIDE